MIRKSFPQTSKYVCFGLLGIVLLAGSLFGLDKLIVPNTQAICNSQPNCNGDTGSWTVDEYQCHSLCSCSGNNYSNTCYYESGHCNDAPSQPAFYEHCYQGTCACPSGTRPGGGSGGGSGEDWCIDNFDCSFGSCNEAGFCTSDGPIN